MADAGHAGEFPTVTFFRNHYSACASLEFSSFKMVATNSIKLFCGNSHPELARLIAKRLGSYYLVLLAMKN
jgi:hypothetical protein